jgi:hypothetical protein
VNKTLAANECCYRPSHVDSVVTDARVTGPRDKSSACGVPVSRIHAVSNAINMPDTFQFLPPNTIDVRCWLMSSPVANSLIPLYD